MRCNNCLKDYDDRLDVCPYCGNKSKSNGLDVKPVIKKVKQDKPSSRKRITEFFKRNFGRPSPVIIAGILVLALTSAVTAIPRQPWEAPRPEQPQEADLSDKIHKATADEPENPSAAGSLQSAIEAASREEKTFAIEESGFAFVDSRGQVHRFEIKDAAVSELPVDIADNRDFVSLEFSPRANGAGFGIKKDGSVTVLSNGASGVYNYEAALGFLNNMQDIVSFEYEATLDNNKQDKWAGIIGLRKDGTVADVVLRENDDTAVLHPTYDQWKDIKSITVNYAAAVGLKKDGTISEIGTPRDYEDYTGIAAVPQGNIYDGGEIFLKSDGTLLQKSDASADSANQFSDWTDIAAFCANRHYTIGIKKDGTAIVSKSRDEHKAPDLSDWKNIVAVQANDSFAVGKTFDGTFVMATSDATLKSNFEKTVNQYTKA